MRDLISVSEALKNGDKHAEHPYGGHIAVRGRTAVRSRLRYRRKQGVRMGVGSRARDFGVAAGKWRPAARLLVSLPLSGHMGGAVMTRMAYAVRRNNQEARPLPTGAVHMERMHCKRTRRGSGLGVTFTRDSLRNLS